MFDRAIRWYVSMNALFHRQTDIGVQETEGGFRSQMATAADVNDINYDELSAELNREVERFTNLGSGWTLTAIMNFVLHIGQYRPLSGSSFIATPKSLMAKQAIVNVFNPDDNLCFAWAVLSAVFPATKNTDRISKYRSHLSEINLTGLKFPVPVSQISRFEKNNPSISVNVYALGDDENNIIPLHVTKCGIRDKHVDLLMLASQTKDNFHYTWIKNMSGLICRRSKTKKTVFVCPHCVHPFSNEQPFRKHLPDCAKHVYQVTQYPSEDDNKLKWQSRAKTERVPFIIYSDFESCLVPVNDQSVVVSEHVPSGFCLYTVATEQEFETSPIVYSGRDCMNVFYDRLASEQSRIARILGDKKPMSPLTSDELDRFDKAQSCPRCNETFTGANWKVMHHNHRTGKFVDALCNSCNLQIKSTEDEFFIPVVFHNLKNYDAHHIFRNFGKRVAAQFDVKGRRSYNNVKIIALNMERYVSFQIERLRFIDSYQFLSASLEKLVGNLTRDAFHHVRKHLGNGDIVLEKGIYPYEWVDSFAKFDNTELPPRDAFYSQLNEEGITDEEYVRAQEVWNSFDCHTFRDYHDIYLKTDVMLLADVFENFRSVSMANYGLDPAHYLTTPSLTWEACLKYTRVELELLTDPEMFTFVEAGMRGGMSVISNRYARANNQYLHPEDYSSSEPKSYICYLDANNLYGWAMSQPLPIGGFRFLSDAEVASIDFAAVPDDAEIGYILECDLLYPSELHALHNDFPLAPEHVTITETMLSPFCKSLNVKSAFTEKLLGTLMPKLKYKLHYRNLKLYLGLGLQMIAIHRVLAFKQTCWLKSYIDFNTTMRQKAKNEFEKDFYKLMNNAFFGKTMENVRKRHNVKLISDSSKMKKSLAKPRLQQFVIINKETVIVEETKATVKLSKPIYVGFAVLDLSKLLIFDFHYNVILKRYGTNARLLFSDTDSLCYHLFTNDAYRDMLAYSDLLDTSGYPTDHFLYSNSNKKVIGKMKDECNGQPPLEFVGLRAKMYSLLTYDACMVKRTAKGIKKRYAHKHVQHDMYLQTLRNRTIETATYKLFRSRAHKLETVNCCKVALCAYDDKRYVLEDGVNTLAYGHVRLKDHVN